MMKRITAVLAAAFGLVVAAPAHAVDFKAGNWEMSVSGEVNGFAIFTSCQRTTVAVGGGLSCSGGNLNGGDSLDRTVIQSGLLPSALVTTVKTRQGGLDVSATVGLYPGIGSAGGHNALGQSVIDLRQNFLTFGDASWGTVKIGRDLGLYGNVILSDMTLLGVGAFASGQAYVTFGHIGTGYIYADWIPGISYTTPNLSGFQATIGVFQGMNLVPFGGGATGSGAFTQHELPMLQAQASYSMTSGPVSGKVWLTGMYQKSDGGGTYMSTYAGDAGVKVGMSGLEVLAYGYAGRGLGTTGIGLDAVSTTGEKRLSWGFLGQVTYKLGKLKLGGSYGESHLDLGQGERIGVNTAALVTTNRSGVVGLYYGITDNLTLVAEYIHSRSRRQDQAEIHDNSGALGAILFF